MDVPMIGVIGGSGLYQMQGLENVTEHNVETPFGTPSDVIRCGDIHGVKVAFLARHGQGHKLLPAEVPYRANVYALKKLGVRYVLSLSAVGSLAEEMAPLDMVVPDQYIDLTKQRQSSFFGQGVVAHVSMAEPVSNRLSQRLAQAVKSAEPQVRLHQKGTYVCIEGPQFSSQAESHWYRAMGAHIIGMTNMPEAKLAREAQLAYATLAMVTDYDCWHPNQAHVSTDMAIANLMKNADRAQNIAAKAIEIIAKQPPSSAAHSALDDALITPREALTKQQLAWLEVLLA